MCKQLETFNLPLYVLGALTNQEWCCPQLTTKNKDKILKLALLNFCIGQINNCKQKKKKKLNPLPSI